MEETQIGLVEESQSQVADESEIFVSGNTRSPSPNETRGLTEESTETQVTAQTQIPSAEETKTTAVEATETGVTGVSKIPSVEKTQTQATAESTNLAKDETQLQHPEETCTHTKTAEYKSTLATEDTDIKFPEKYETETTGKSKPSILNGKEIYFSYVTKKITVIVDLVISVKGMVLLPFFKVRATASTRTQNAVTLFVAILEHLSDNQFKGFRLGNLDPFW